MFREAVTVVVDHLGPRWAEGLQNLQSELTGDELVGFMICWRNNDPATPHWLLRQYQTSWVGAGGGGGKGYTHDLYPGI